ncbi:MAG: VWA domain-containing protein [Planctomycetes bacterium]|nr:VWA domain-containing protein [Planctomycetota bacterium]
MVILAAAIVFNAAEGLDAAGLLIADGGFGGLLDIREHTASVTINNGVAVTEVTQVFRNTENRQVEALYVFPVPRGASVASFSMWINGKEMVGEVLEKEKARQIYTSYKQRRQDPGLLEQKDYKTFELRIFPIGPGAEQKVQIRYYQELEVDSDWATYVYPLATVSKEGLKSQTQGKFALNLDVKSEIPIAELSSPSHDKAFAVARHSESYQQASLEASGWDLNRDVVLCYRLSRPRTGMDMVCSRVSSEDGYFLMTLMAGEDLAAVEAGMDYVFILDISGSMAEQGRYPLARDSVGAFIRELGTPDRLEVLTFNVQSHALFRHLRPADESAKSAALDFLASQSPRGGTLLHPAITAAYRYGESPRTLNVVILSDGMTEQAERARLLDLIRSRPAHARVFCIGVGNEVNRPLLEQLAQDSGGLAAFISAGDDFQRQAKAFRRKLARAVATDLEVGFTGLGIYDTEPKTLANLYHGMPLRIYGRYRDAGRATVALSGNLDGQSFRKEFTVELPAEEAGNPEIERMWAWHRMDRLLKEADRTDSGASVVAEVVRLGEAYSIASEHTSFIVLENDSEYQRWRIDRRNALRLERDRRAQEKVRSDLEAIRSKALADLGPVPEEMKTLPAALPARPSASPQASTSPTAAPNPSRSRSWNLDLPSGGGFGGGALDPLTALAALGLAALAAARKNSSRS